MYKTDEPFANAGILYSCLIQELAQYYGRKNESEGSRKKQIIPILKYGLIFSS